MPRKSASPRASAPAAVRFTQLTAPVVPGYTICNLSEIDIKELHAGRVPDWIIRTTDLFLAGNQGPAALVAAMNAARQSPPAPEQPSPLPPAPEEDAHAQREGQ